MRKGDVIAAVLVVLLGGPFLYLQVADHGVERHAPRVAPIPPVLDSAMRAVTVAESIAYARHHRFPDDARQLRTLVALPTAVRLLQVEGTDSTWTVRLDGALGGEWRRCTLSGGVRAGDARSATTTAFCDSKPRR